MPNLPDIEAQSLKYAKLRKAVIYAIHEHAKCAADPDGRGLIGNFSLLLLQFSAELQEDGLRLIFEQYNKQARDGANFMGHHN